MAVVSCTLSRTGRSGSFFIENGGGIGGEMIVEWDVVTDSDTDGWQTVYTGALAATPDPLPDFYDTYNLGGGEVNTDLFFSSVTPTQNEEKLTRWKLRGSYKHLQAGLTAGDAQTDPLQRPWKYRIEFDQVSVVITEGWNVDQLEPLVGDTRPPLTRGPIVNTAAQEFDTVHEEPRTRLIFVGSRNFKELEDITDIGIQYADSLNSVAFRGYPGGHCEFLSITTSDLIRESGTEYYRGTVRIAMNQKPVQINAVNAGFKAWEFGTLKLKNIVDSEGQTVPEPVILTATGEDPRVAGAAKVDFVSYWTRENFQNYNSIFSTPPPA
jgi:hypothetical protein